MRRKSLLIFTLIAALLCSMTAIGLAQENEPQEEKKEAYQFTMDLELDHTPVKSQGGTGTCWSFATISFLESEAMRNGRDELNLSEMYIVRHAYSDKAENYMRLHGNMNFGQGGACHDVIDQMRDHGLVIDEAYTGLRLGSDRHNHSEVSRVLKAVVDGVLASRRPSIRWEEAYNAVADAYLGEVPEEFEYEGKTYTPKEFMEYLKLDPDDYIEVTSFTHLPLYEKVMLKLPDNWTFSDDYYNVKVDDLARIVEHSLKEGYTVVYGGDVSNATFRTVGIVPEDDEVDLNKVEEPVAEKEVTAEMRQNLYDNFTITDDHAMHIVGIAHDQKGNTYFYTKNSWGDSGKYDGYNYMSKAYVNLNVTAMMVNKNALPKDIKKKFGL